MKRIYILGVNGNAQDVLESVLAIRQLKPSFPEIGGFLDDTKPVGTQVGEVTVLGKIEEASRIPEALFVNGIGSPSSYVLKPDIISRANVPLNAFVTVIHPSAVVSSSAKIGQGSVILSNCSVGAWVSIGNHVMVLQNAIISHDSVIEDYAVIATAACLSGLVKVMENAYVGSSACIRSGVEVGKRSLIGMGSVALQNIPAGEVWCGNPAKFLRAK